MASFNILNYVKSDISNEIIVKMINYWETDRGADGSENLFYLSDIDDFAMVAKMYGLDYTIILYQKHNFCFGGANYKTPVGYDKENLMDMVVDTYDIQFVKEMIINGNIWLFKEWLDVSEIIKDFVTLAIFGLISTEN